MMVAGRGWVYREGMVMMVYSGEIQVESERLDLSDDMVGASISWL